MLAVHSSSRSSVGPGSAQLMGPQDIQAPSDTGSLSPCSSQVCRCHQPSPASGRGSWGLGFQWPTSVGCPRALTASAVSPPPLSHTGCGNTWGPPRDPVPKVTALGTSPRPAPSQLCVLAPLQGTRVGADLTGGSRGDPLGIATPMQKCLARGLMPGLRQERGQVVPYLPVASW